MGYKVVKGESEERSAVSRVWTLTPGLSRGVGTSSCWGKSHTYGSLNSSPASFRQNCFLFGAEFFPVTYVTFVGKLYPQD